MKASSKLYKGIEYVAIGDLPREQQDALRKTFDPQLIIKILVDKAIVSNCVQYKDYVLWYDETFCRMVAPTVVEEPVAEKIALESGKMTIAFGKA